MQPCLIQGFDFCRRNSGIDRNDSTLEVWLTDGNEYSGNTYTVPRQVPGTLRFISTGDVDRVLLEITDNNGVATGLKVDGTEDGTYELRATAYDRAGNASAESVAVFVYDSQAPVMTLPTIDDDITFAWPSLDFEGTTQDNRGGSGINRIEVTLQPVDSRGYPTSDPPIIYNQEAILAPLGIGPFDPDPPQRTFRFSGSLSQVTSDQTCLLTVRSYDEGGNFAEKKAQVKIRANSLPAPVLSSPAQSHTTSSRIITFDWNTVAGAAGYRVKIITPNNNEIVQEVDAPSTALTVNLESYADGNGKYTWAVASRDSSGNYGGYSLNRIIYVDNSRPEVVSIDIFDPSPESTGSINEGEVRFTIRFSEHMRTDKPLTVTVTPQNVTAQPLTVQMMSYIGDTWIGRTFIPDAIEDEPDYNGLATISVSGGYDLGDNPMVQPQQGFTIFEVDTGPWFTIAMFKNPVNPEDIILLVKGQTRQDGPAERLVSPLSVMVTREGQSDQMPEMNRMGNQSQAFRGAFFLNDSYNSDVKFLVSGSDEQGNTSSRKITLKASTITAAKGLIASSASGLILSAPSGAVSKDTHIFVNDASAMISDLEEKIVFENSSGELTLVSMLGAVEPSGIAFDKNLDLLVDLAIAAPAADSSFFDKMALYRFDGEKCHFLKGGVSQGSLTGVLNETGGLVICADLACSCF